MALPGLIVQRTVKQFDYVDGRRAYMDVRNRVTVLNSKGRVVSHYKPSKPAKEWNRIIRKYGR